MSAITAILFVALIVQHKAPLKTNVILGIGVGLIILAAIISIIVICNNMSSSDVSLKDHLMKINPEDQSSYRIVKNINNDSKYFADETGKDEFDKLSIDEMRNKKSYYDSNHKLIKKDTVKDEAESDIQEYFGGKNGCEELIKNIDELAEAYKFTYAITTLSALIILLMIIFMVKAYSRRYITSKSYNQLSAFASPEDLEKLNDGLMKNLTLQDELDNSFMQFQ
jgi:uncharacterized membrane protein